MRTWLPWLPVYLAFATFSGYSVYGVYLAGKVGEYRGPLRPSKAERWDPRSYAPGAEPWLVRFRRWHRWKNVVWLGCILGGNLLYWLLEP